MPIVTTEKKFFVKVHILRVRQEETVARANFTDEAVGMVLFIRIPNQDCEAILQFIEGFDSPNPVDYFFIIDGKNVSVTMRKNLKISNGATEPNPNPAIFEESFCNGLDGKEFIIKLQNEVIGRTTIEGD
ncbi:hypothetical protein C1646_676395 [Rhizophagus diaphanus]|nr:hypothetical protein C1646_676395 [Rhizophagus diaphanus] [Rhizophagus sp. MUCL 43196]